MIKNFFNTKVLIGIPWNTPFRLISQRIENLVHHYFHANSPKRFLWQERTWLSKILEGYFTNLIELFWDKKRILEVYLNGFKCGECVFGYEKASQIYFKRSSLFLSPFEFAGMAAILPNP